METFQPNPLLGFGVLVGGIALAALSADTRLALVALLAQYVGCAFMMAASDSAVAWLVLAVGGMVAAMLYLSIRARRGVPAEHTATLRLPFRAAALLMALAAGGVLATQWPLPYAGGLPSLACYALMAGFVAQAGLFQQPARVGMAALTLLIGAALYAQSAGGTLLLIGLILSAHLITALVAGHLHPAPEEGLP